MTSPGVSPKLLTTAIPHREGRAFDEVGQCIERAFGLRKAAGEPGALGEIGRGVAQPQQGRAGGQRRRRRSAANVEHAVRPRSADAGVERLGSKATASQRLVELGEIGRVDAPCLLAQIVEARPPTGCTKSA